MPVDKDSYFNQIDIGISLCFIDICLTNNIIDYEKKLYSDGSGDKESTLNV